MDRKKAVRVYHRNLAILVGLVLLTFILIPAMVKSPYMLNIFVLTFYMSTLSMAWNLLGGMTGQNSLGHAAYMGLGAYAGWLRFSVWSWWGWLQVLCFTPVLFCGDRISPWFPLRSESPSAR